MLVDKFHPTPSASTRTEGVLGRLMRAFPARVLVAEDLSADPIAPVSRSAAASAAPRPSLLGRLDAWLWRQQQRETEAWLGQAKDASELEQRMRLLERGNSGFGRF